MGEEALTARISKATKKAHAKSNSITMLKIGIAFTDRELWAKSIGWFYFVMSQVELSMEARKDHPVIKKVWPHFKKLRRTEAYETDLQFYLGNDWRAKLTKTEAVQKYVEMLQRIEREEPLLLLCYAYHFYVALISGGGPILKKMATKALKLKEGEGGVEVFTMDGLDGKDYKQVYDNLGLSAADEERIIQESLLLFERNNEVMLCLSGHIGWRDAFRSIQSPPVQYAAGAVVLVLAVGVAFLKTSHVF
mmetsp:Transcript_7812/g.19534  ORF Transcript_7812/g.19534 Transcript_7812/m.19534 type:complete len:249 (+) Transcript_7812:171-917(+)